MEVELQLWLAPFPSRQSHHPRSRDPTKKGSIGDLKELRRSRIRQVSSRGFDRSEGRSLSGFREDSRGSVIGRSSVETAFSSSFTASILREGLFSIHARPQLLGIS